MPYAHTRDGQGPSDWEPLEKHLEEAAALAGDYAAAFEAREWGMALGRWHDLGKYSAAFQDYLLGSSDPNAGEEDVKHGGRVDHSTFGAQYAARTVGGPAGHALAFCIAGHHAGLTDATADDEGAAGSALAARLAAGPPRVPPVVLPLNLPPAPPLRLPYKPHPNEVGLQFAFFTRMLFSCLVDGDRTGTEAFCNPEGAAARRCVKPGVGDLNAALIESLRRMQDRAAPTPVKPAAGVRAGRLRRRREPRPRPGNCRRSKAELRRRRG